MLVLDFSQCVFSFPFELSRALALQEVILCRKTNCHILYGFVEGGQNVPLWPKHLSCPCFDFFAVLLQVMLFQYGSVNYK